MDPAATTLDPAPPAALHLLGSWPLRTQLAPSFLSRGGGGSVQQQQQQQQEEEEGGVVVVDVGVQIPESCLRKKDQLNYR